MNTKREKTQFELPRGIAGRILFFFMNKGHKSIYENAAKVLELKPEDDLLEVGCGNGHFIKNYASHVRSVAGLDLSELSVKLATRKNKDRVAVGSAEFVQGDATKLPWEDNRFSVTTAMASFMLFPEPLASLKEMNRVLRPGGRAIICLEWNAEDGKDHSKDIKKYGIAQFCTEDDAREMMKNAGFTDVSISYAKGMMMPKMMLVRGVKA
jgi:ubiquinone/menaquinone biosynthesis C-methylase UbiE